ncbi:MAG: type I phosphomannose isomerase catalytic subunit [Lachnospiraceae bacterium]|nr:type I phosphomannose isomerase catalytic subunit [Lachnospiraceae bacterium]
MSVLKLKPACKDYLWGGHRLAEEYGIEYDGEILAESWELSCHPDGPSVIVNGPFAGLTLEKYIEKEGKQVLGNHCRRFRDFPILIKFIDAKQNLSIQVHPDNKYALKNEGQYGKTEMWYIMDAKEGAFLYYGFKKEISKEEFAKRIQEDTLLEVLNAVPVHKGDVLFIESGTIHAIGENILIAEIQQNSNVTYRVYDYGRVGKDGKKRDLHIEKALAVTNRVPIMKSGSSYPHVADCDYFTVDKLNLDGCMMKKMEGTVTEDSFVSILMLDGKGKITCGEETVSYKKGESLFLPAGSGHYEIEGSCDALITTIREKAGPVRVGIDIGGTDTKIGLVDVNQKLLASAVISTEAGTGAEAVIRRIGEAVVELLDQEKIPMDQCIGVGVGVPGTVDRKKGMVVYSNNITWEQVPLTQMLSAYLPVPIQIANDADCAALGEAASGGAKDYQDVVMLTLGTGVGGGIILDGKIYEGGRMGGCELGHMVIVENGEPCTCGRKGCLEAYASATALRKVSEKKFGKSMEPAEIFRLAEEGNETAKEIVEDYIRKLGTGIVNIVNIFRPQALLLGGGIAAQGEVLLAPIREMVKTGCFGGAYGELPEIRTAELGNRAGMIGAANLV